MITDRRSNLTKKSSSCATASLKTGNWTGKVSGNLVYKKKYVESNNGVEDRRSYSSSPCYKGLPCHEKVLGIITEPESTNPIVHDAHNLLSPSPYYKGLLYTERVDHGTGTGIGTTLEVGTTATIPHKYLVSPYYQGLLCHEKVSGIRTEPESTTPIVHDVPNLLSPSPYYKGLLYTEKVDHGTSTGMCSGTTIEVETTASIQHEYLVSPYYKGLLNPTTSPDYAAGSNSRMSFRAKKPKFGFFKFKPKDERPPTLVKVYSTDNSIDQESLRQRGSEATSPQFSPPLRPPEPPSEPPLPQPLVLQFDAFGALCILKE